MGGQIEAGCVSSSADPSDFKSQPPRLAMLTISDVACPVCGCVCDDLQITVEGSRVVRAERACALAEPWFQAQSSTTRPAAEIDGEPADFDRAIAVAADLLRPTRAPLIYGLSRSSTGGQQAAVKLADQLGANIDTTASLCHGPSIMAMQAVGESTCTLGEISTRADLVIFWGCNPAASHPRHAERYSVFPRCDFLPNGRADRTVVMIGDERDVHDWRLDRDDARPDWVIPIEPDRDFEAITVLRALVRGVPIRDQSLPESTLQSLTELARRMKSCRYGVVFFGLGLTATEFHRAPRAAGLGHLNVENLLRLVTELNDFTRFHARRMRLYGDVSGADSVLCWQTGYPFAVNLSRGYPRYNPGEFSANDLLTRGEPDACVLVGSETLGQFSSQALDHLRRIPVILLDYPATTPIIDPTVRFTTAVYGLHAAGTAYRMDEVPIAYRASLPAPWPTDEAVLQQLSERLTRSAN